VVSKETLIACTIIILITYTLGLSLVSQAFPQSQTTATFSNAGTIQIQTTAGIGVYSDLECDTPLTSLAWGTLEPGASQTRDCYIKNEGNTPLTLSLYTSDWSSQAADGYLNLTWNYNGDPLDLDEVVLITLTLSVNPSIKDVTTFSFNINIVGTS
jgi:hypothetical protein